jgi:cell division protein FtsL
MDRRGHADVIRTAAFAEHREPHGRRQVRRLLMKPVPDLRGVDLVVPGRPHLDPLQVAPVEPVADHPVDRRQLARQHVGLHRPRDTGKAGRERRPLAASQQRGQSRHGVEVATAQAGNRKKNDRFRHRTVPDRCGARSQISDLRSQISDLRFQISDLRFQISDLRFQISDLRSQISDLRSQISDLRSQISDLRSQISDFRSQISDFRSQILPPAPSSHCNTDIKNASKSAAVSINLLVGVPAP